jgi:hypothetical protein
MKTLPLDMTYKPRVLIARDEDDAVAWLSQYPTIASEVCVMVPSVEDAFPTAETLQGVRAGYATSAARAYAPHEVNIVLDTIREAKRKYAGLLIEPPLEA